MVHIQRIRSHLTHTVIAMAVTMSGTFFFHTSAQAQSVDEIAMMKGTDRQAKLEAGAKKEGKVVLYSSVIVNQALRPMAEAFEKKYPGIDVEYWRSNSSGILQKIMAEQRARSGRYDVIEWGGGTMQAIKGNAVRRFWSPSLDEYHKDFYDTKNHMWAGTRLSYFGIGFNTKALSRDDVPKSYDALIDPKWKGKMAWPIAQTGNLLFITNQLITRGEKAGEEYLKKLSEQTLTAYTGSARALVDRVGQGEYPMALNIFAHHPLISATKGAPLASQMLEPIPTNLSTVQLGATPPNPHAAMLLIDFITSKDGHTVLKNADYFPSHPAVDANESLQSIVPKFLKMKETVFKPETLFEWHGKATAIYQKYFK